MGWNGHFVHGTIKHIYVISGECPSQMVLKICTNGDFLGGLFRQNSLTRNLYLH